MHGRTGVTLVAALAIAAAVIAVVSSRTSRAIAQQAADKQASGAVARRVDGFKPVAPRSALMEWHEKAFGELKVAIGKKNSEAAEYAWLLAELANINARHSDKDDYRAWAEAVRDSAATLAEAAGKKEFDRAKELATKINATCTACHDAYQK